MHAEMNPCTSETGVCGDLEGYRNSPDDTQEQLQQRHADALAKQNDIVKQSDIDHAHKVLLEAAATPQTESKDATQNGDKVAVVQGST